MPLGLHPLRPNRQRIGELTGSPLRPPCNVLCCAAVHVVWTVRNAKELELFADTLHAACVRKTHEPSSSAASSSSSASSSAALQFSVAMYVTKPAAASDAEAPAPAAKSSARCADAEALAWVREVARAGELGAFIPESVHAD
eukprot:SAG25_NODE_33_length_20262_cov_33.203293_31_plen_142_part_00